MLSSAAVKPVDLSIGSVSGPPAIPVQGTRMHPVLRVLLVVMLTLGSSFAAVALAPAASAAGPRLAGFDYRMLELVNDARYNAGLPGLKPAGGLSNLSLWWSGQMADGATGNVLKHNPDAFQQTLRYGASNRTAWAENVAKWNPASTSADAIFNAYMASPGHKANILGSAYRFVGIASTTGGNGTSWNTMTFTDKVDPGQVVTPTGNLESITLTDGTIRLLGWAYDPVSSGQSIPVHVYVNGVGYARTADNARSDVNNVYGVGGNHGFDISIPAVTGKNQVCAYALSVTGAGNTALVCTTMTYTKPATVGYYDSATASGSAITVAGWAYDPSRPTASVPLHVYLNGKLVNGEATDELRQDVNNALGVTGNHGFTTTVNGPVGKNQVCLYAVSLTGGANSSLGCRQVTVQPKPATSGNLDGITRSGNSIRVSGWAYDPASSSTSLQVHVYVGSNAVAINANKPRTDVNSAIGISGNHGFDQTVSGPAGGVTVCAYAISVTGGANTNLGCKAV